MEERVEDGDGELRLVSRGGAGGCLRGGGGSVPRRQEREREAEDEE